MGKGERRTPLSEKEKDGFRPEERAGRVRVEMWERQLNMQSSYYVPSPVLGVSCMLPLFIFTTQRVLLSPLYRWEKRLSKPFLMLST